MQSNPLFLTKEKAAFFFLMALVKSSTTKIMHFTTAVFLALLIMSPNFLSCQAGNCLGGHCSPPPPPAAPARDFTCYYSESNIDKINVPDFTRDVFIKIDGPDEMFHPFPNPRAIAHVAHTPQAPGTRPPPPHDAPRRASPDAPVAAAARAPAAASGRVAAAPPARRGGGGLHPPDAPPFQVLKQKTVGRTKVLLEMVTVYRLADIFVASFEISFEEQLSMLDSVDLKLRLSKATELVDRHLQSCFPCSDDNSNIWKHAQRELRRLRKMQPQQPGYSSSRAYLELLSDLAQAKSQ
ncbi:hypothetical protein ACP4OV_029407 [Aristida adscensionis]